MAGGPAPAQSAYRRRTWGAGPSHRREFGGRGLPLGLGVGGPRPRPRPGLSSGCRSSTTEHQAGRLRERSVVRWGLRGRREVLRLTVRGPETRRSRAPEGILFRQRPLVTLGDPEAQRRVGTRRRTRGPLASASRCR
ncbi:hypothetical protein P7K49_009635 [Saguinus oedipus]|uniref:Uncharacterized protein n=1 Tax=Saguinus oedipus TaxID=9490 RepID=A0ABQ9VKI6_SAGOE|nr:hypothetical protein P7K49_009635 [Saguinus oedipus]